MSIVEQAFFHGLLERLDESIRQLFIDEQELTILIGMTRIDELLEFWKKDMSEEDEAAFKIAMDYWDKKVILTWARKKRAQRTRAEVNRMLLNINKSLPAI
ncbi:MAG: hypothetical protein QX191_07265 [Methylococcaceae bacterium]|jgi:hypothetical protein|nr:hypothetical protein [Methylococcales bacterium]